MTEVLGPEQMPRMREAYQRLLAEIQAVSESDVLAINLDIPVAMSTVIGVLSEITARRDAIAKLPGFNIDAFDKLHSYTLALGHTHALYLAASAPPQAIEELSGEGIRLRELLLTSATALAVRGLIDGKPLKELKGINGYRHLAFDLLTLAALLRSNWAHISSKTAVALTELDRAETLGEQIITTLGLRDQEAASASVAALDRQRAFSLFIAAYNQARRAICYLRWDYDDWDQIAPSLYAFRTAKRKTQDETAEKARASAAEPAESHPNGSEAGDIGMPDAEPYLKS